MAPTAPHQAPTLQQTIAERARQATWRVPAKRPAPPPRQFVKPSEPDISSLARAIQERGRRYRIFPVSGFFGLGGKAIEEIGVLYATGKDLEAALIAAAKSDSHDQARARQRELLWILTAEVKDGRLVTVAKTGKPYPAFPSSKWMRDHLGPDEEAVLMRLVGEVRAEFAPQGGVDAEDPDAIAEELDATVEAPGARLAHLGREELTALTVGLARRLVAVTRARDALMEAAG